jgi:Na+/glutamate symporter
MRKKSTVMAVGSGALLGSFFVSILWYLSSLKLPLILAVLVALWATGCLVYFVWLGFALFGQEYQRRWFLENIGWR